MAFTMGWSALRLLDEVQGLAQIEAFDPERFLQKLRDDAAAGEGLPLADLAVLLDGLRDLLPAIDAFAAKSLRVRLDHALAESPLPPQFRAYLASMATSYDGDLGLLRRRVTEAAMRTDPRRAAQTAGAVIEAVERVLEVRARLWQGALGETGRIAAALLPSVQREARDRNASDAERLPSRLARRDLELLLEHPERLLEDSFADRTRKLPPPEDEPEEAPPRKPFDLLEID